MMLDSGSISCCFFSLEETPYCLGKCPFKTLSQDLINLNVCLKIQRIESIYCHAYANHRSALVTGSGEWFLACWLGREFEPSKDHALFL